MQVPWNHTGRDNTRTLAAAVLLVALAPMARADDWPQWRGPRVDGVTDENLAPAGQHPQRLDVAWRRSIGVGFGTVSLRDDRLYVMGWENGADHLYCLNPGSGVPVWTRRYREGVFDNMHRGGPSATPAVDEEQVYTVSKSGRVQAFAASDGEPRWSVHGPEALGVSVPSWGFSGSPILLGRAVIVDMGRIVAFDRASGQVLWKSDAFGAGYASPVPFRCHDRDLLAAFPAQGLVVLDASGGQTLASAAWTTSYDVNAATPLVHENRILIASGYDTGAGLFRLTPSMQLHAIWKNTELRAQMSSPVRIDDTVYGFDNGRFLCVDLATGQRRWMQRGLGKGSFVVAGRHLVILSERGRLVIAPVSPDAFTETASVELFDVDQGWIMPVVANGRIYCRSGDGELAMVTVAETR